MSFENKGAIHVGRETKYNFYPFPSYCEDTGSLFNTDSNSPTKRSHNSSTNYGYCYCGISNKTFSFRCKQTHKTFEINLGISFLKIHPLRCVSAKVFLHHNGCNFIIFKFQKIHPLRCIFFIPQWVYFENTPVAV